MHLTIYAAHHTRPLYPAGNSLFVPIWSGGPPLERSDYVVDAGVPRKPSLGYNEMSQQYFVWKHLVAGLDYVGFEHYRRIFLFDDRFGPAAGTVGGSMPKVQPGNWHAFVDSETFAGIIARRSRVGPADIATFHDAVSGYDIILPHPYGEMSLSDQWRVCGQDPAMLDLLETCTRATAHHRDRPFDLHFASRNVYFCNMFVARSAIFDDYMRLWEQVMFALQDSLDMRTRLPSFLSERLFSSYVNARIAADGLRVLELPFCLCEAMKVAHES